MEATMIIGVAHSTPEYMWMGAESQLIDVPWTTPWTTSKPQVRSSNNQRTKQSRPGYRATHPLGNLSKSKRVILAIEVAPTV